MREIKFLNQVKVREFANSSKEYSVDKKRHERVVLKSKNTKVETVFTVIGVTQINLGYTEWIGQEEGYWFHKTGAEKVFIVANGLGRRYKALPEDLELLKGDGENEKRN
ncbi:hypothetical protein [Bacillus cereus group sp. N21]|uniref:hypothetical protein n=1 Tax=Bacillus cereus group sp. N21 TaxID=2794591 RepID=UPI0018F33BE8|nr:hypothetical protein [Bacillus cereus group sp. N21]MBJ8031892.1 hypothetical protein [Bacillus cereus group sp. N21]